MSAEQMFCGRKVILSNLPYFYSKKRITKEIMRPMSLQLLADAGPAEKPHIPSKNSIPRINPAVGPGQSESNHHYACALPETGPGIASAMQRLLADENRLSRRGSERRRKPQTPQNRSKS